MKLIFTADYQDLKTKLSSIGGEWDESQPNRKFLRLNGGVMTWYERTGTIQFQGIPEQKLHLEYLVTKILSPDLVGDLEEPTKLSDDLPPKIISDQPKHTEEDISKQYLDGTFENSEIIIGIVSAVGTNNTRFIDKLKNRLSRFNYQVIDIKVSSLLENNTINNNQHNISEYDRIKTLMDLGDKLREDRGNSILAYGVAKLIKEKRGESNKKTAYIVNSLKHPDEVETLRKIYGQGFYLFGIHSDTRRRLDYLIKDKNLDDKQAIELIEIDEDEKIAYGQKTRDTYHLSDFFIDIGNKEDPINFATERFLQLIFSHPYKNPTFDEFAMFMAFSSSVRSGDLSRQVGAVISKEKQIIATGANECPVSGGGLYWAEMNEKNGEIIDRDGGKDYKRNEDSNKVEQNEIINNILSDTFLIEDISQPQIDQIKSILERSRIRDLTEFGRVVHAEMEAILSCNRSGISCMGATLYCTTFPCHNCAKHIIASGIKRVVYVEPYPKSKALEFHSDSIQLRTTSDEALDTDQVTFEPFTGVGARRFLDFFSMNLGTGNKLKRKNKDGSTLEWTQKIRVALLPASYREVEDFAALEFERETK